MTATTELLAGFEQAVGVLRRTVGESMSDKVDPDVRDAVAEFAVLQGHSQLEAFVEELFYLCVLDDPSVPGKPVVAAVSSRDHADLLLRANAEKTLPFLSWLPADRLLEAARVFLDSENPFERLRYRDVERRELQTLVTVRNAVAHPSDSAGDKLRELSSARGYPVGRPARFLLSLRSGTPEILVLLTRLEQIARALSAFSESDAATYLEPERLFNASEKAPAGTYICARCGEQIVHQGLGRLGTCTACNPLSRCPTCGRVPQSSTSWRRETGAAPPA